MRVGWSSFALGVCLPAFAASAQSNGTAGTFVVAGSVIDAHHDAVADASIEIVDGQTILQRLRADSAGKFVASGLAVRALSVRVRHFGYQSRTVDVTIPAAERRTTVVIELQVAAEQLAAANITADDSPGQKLREFYDRMASNKLGTYIDPDAIEKRRVSVASEYLRQVPGVRLRPLGTAGNEVTIRGCSPLVWIDGARMRGEFDELVQANDVAAIEIYRAFSGVPAQYFDRAATCGTILVWTKSQ